MGEAALVSQQPIIQINYGYISLCFLNYTKIKEYHKLEWLTSIQTPESAKMVEAKGTQIKIEQWVIRKATS